MYWFISPVRVVSVAERLPWLVPLSVVDIVHTTDLPSPSAARRTVAYVPLTYLAPILSFGGKPIPLHAA